LEGKTKIRLVDDKEDGKDDKDGEDDIASGTIAEVGKDGAVEVIHKFKR
jgi:hypothetical protein